MNLDMDAYQLISLIIVVVAGAWGWNRWLITRMDRGDDAVKDELKEHSKDLHGRVSKARDEMVPRHEFEREVNRVHTDIGGLRDEVVRGNERTASMFDQQGKRLDQILLATKNRKDD